MDDAWLRGKRVAVTGRLVAMTHADFAELVASRGGEAVALPNRGTSLLVIGQEGWPLEDDGRQTVSLQRARRLRAFGYPLDFVQEEDFYRRLGLAEPQSAIHRRSTIHQLSRVLKVPGRQLRAWIRAGLIEPVEVVHRLAYFDFRQVAGAKTICELTAAGVAPQQIRESLEQLRHWLPGIDAPLAQLSLLERDGRLLVRLGDDRLAEPSGQLHFDFITAPVSEPELLAFWGRSAEAWFEEALELEDLGRPAEAAVAYREAVRLEPDDPVLHFNLGNALYACGELASAAEHFRRAVAHDASYAEAWNNLGNALVDLGHDADALEAYERALRCVATYADAHYNLAAALARLGRVQDAARHWRAVLQFDPGSPWCDEVRQRLADLASPPVC